MMCRMSIPILISTRNSWKKWVDTSSRFCKIMAVLSGRHLLSSFRTGYPQNFLVATFVLWLVKLTNNLHSPGDRNETRLRASAVVWTGCGTGFRPDGRQALGH